MPRRLPNLLKTLDDFIFAPAGHPARAGRGVDLVFGTSGTGQDSAGTGRDLVLGRDGLAEALNGGPGADFIFGQYDDTFVVTKGDVVVVSVPQGAEFVPKPVVVWAPAEPDWSTVSLVFSDLSAPTVTDVSRSGLVSVRDRAGQTIEVQLQTSERNQLDLSAQEARSLALALEVGDADAPILAGTVWDGLGGRRDEVLIGGEVIKGRGGRDLLVADSETEKMKGGRGEDMLVSDTRGVMMDGGRGVDLYVLTGHAQTSATGDPDCLAWDIIGPEVYEIGDLWDFLGANSLADPAYENDVLWLTDLDAASVQVRLGNDGGFVFRDGAGVTAEVMFENRQLGLLGEDDLDQIVGRVYAGADALLLEADQFLV